MKQFLNFTQIRKSYFSSITGVDNTASCESSNKLTLESQDSVLNGLPLLKTTQIDELSDGFHKIENDKSKGLEISGKDTAPNSCSFQGAQNDASGASTSGLHDGAANPTNSGMASTDVHCDSSVMGVSDLKQGMSMDSTNCAQSSTNEHPAQSPQPNAHGDDTAASNTAERGTQIQFKGLNLEESISTMRGSKIVFTLECSRCKQRIDQRLSASGCVLNLIIIYQYIKQRQGISLMWKKDEKEKTIHRFGK